jgi:4a-hydroxytetrahydrobiopterin dehydratase
MTLLSIAEINDNLERLSDWSMEDIGKSISRTFEFPDFRAALSFVNKVGEIAEAEGHHPDINIHDYNKVDISLSTHSAGADGGLTGKDFKVASEIDKI